MKMPLPELFTGKHDGETLRQYINAYSTYFKLTGVKDENMLALFAKMKLYNTVYTWYDSQGNDDNIITFSIEIDDREQA